MTNVLHESKVENGADADTFLGFDAEEVAKRIEQGVNDAKAALSAKLEDGKIAAERMLKRSRYAVEDGVSETAHMVKRHPFGSLAVAFAAGAALALLVPRSTRK